MEQQPAAHLASKVTECPPHFQYTSQGLQGELLKLPTIALGDRKIAETSDTLQRGTGAGQDLLPGFTICVHFHPLSHTSESAEPTRGRLGTVGRESFGIIYGNNV